MSELRDGPNLTGTDLERKLDEVWRDRPGLIGWITTVSKAGGGNLAPYSFFNLVSGYPPFVIFSSGPRKDSQTNAEETGEFVVNFTPAGTV